MVVGEMQRKLATWSTQDPERRFDRLLRLIAHPTWLAEAARLTLQSPGARTAGIDGVTGSQFERELGQQLEVLRKELLLGSYYPQAVRRVYIPKQNGKLRPLGIPTIRDRVVQRAMLMVMEPIWESDFSRYSYGFRPRRSVHQAISALAIQLTDGRTTGGRWVIEGDLASYFDTVHHKKLVSCVKRRIREQRFIQLLWRMLRAGQMDRGMLRTTYEGVPQGGVLSPLLANIMLNEFDRYMTTQYVGTHARNIRRGWNQSVTKQTPIAVREGRSYHPCVAYVRYADDFVVVVKGTKRQAEVIREVLRDFLEGTLRLVLNMDKTHVTHVNDGFVFLGHRIIRKRGGRGHMRVVTSIPWASYRRFADELTRMLSSNHHLDPVDMIRNINRKIRGWTAFYQHATYTGRMYQRIDTAVFWKLAHWLARRYKMRIKRAMRRWYMPSSLLRGVRTWVVHRMVDGRRQTAALHKCIHGLKQHHVMAPVHTNPYLLPSRTGPVHRAYAEIATMIGI